MIEYSSINKQLNWKKSEVIAAGIDIGAISSKAVILLDRQQLAASQVKTLVPKESATRALTTALSEADLKLEDIHFIVATGCGRTQVPFAQKTITEVACGATGALHIWGPSIHTILDAGGQSCRVIHSTDKGRVTDFLWNDKCAAGIGHSLETFSGLVKRDMTEMGNIALQYEKFPKFSDFCVVYAQSESMDLMRSKVPLEEVIVGYHYAMAKRISTLVARAGIKKDFVIIGGLARNPGIVYWLDKILKVANIAAKPEWDPAFVVALGAALFADTFCRMRSNT